MRPLKWTIIDLDILDIRGDFVLLSDGTVNKWIPKNQVMNFDEDWQVGQTEEMEMPIWILKKEGWM